MARPHTSNYQTHSHHTATVFLVGVPLAAIVLGLIHFGPLKESPFRRYFIHPVEFVEVVLFCCAVSALGGKLWRYPKERRACQNDYLPPWNGQVVPVEEANTLLAEVRRLPRRLQDTILVRRLMAVLDFLCRRGSADDLDDQLRTLTDNDSIALEGSYSLTRFITWAIPILGFLGTVLGITGAISGVTPEVLEKSLSTVTDGLALAFDTTALGLALTMVTMFCSFVVERAEQGVLETVDRITEQELAHRFERTGAEGGDYLAVARQQTQVLVKATEHLVQRQVELWAQAFEQSSQRQATAIDRHQAHFTTALKSALEATLEAHRHRLAALEKQAVDQSAGIMERIGSLANAIRETGREQREAMAKIAKELAGPLEAAAQLQAGEKQLVHLQESLNQNLATLAGAGAFEQAVDSLTAAIHLLTARTVGSGQWPPSSRDAAKSPSVRSAGPPPTLSLPHSRGKGREGGAA
jgi:biopolymer transport protein ExbB/TolQ